MVNPNLEKIILVFLWKNKEYLDKVEARFFENDIIRKMYDLSYKFWKKFHEIPSKEQLEEIAIQEGLEDVLTKDHMRPIFDLDIEKYDPIWAKQSVHAWIEYKNMDNSLFDVMQYIKTTKLDQDNITEVVNKVKQIILEKNSVNFDFKEGLDFFDPKSHVQPANSTFSTGYPYLDQITAGGYSAKTLWVFVGQPKVGKSVWLCNLACQAVRNGYNTAYISLEMGDTKIVRRLGSNLLNVTMREYEEFAKDQDKLSKKLKNIQYDSFKIPGQLFVREFPTSDASVLDVEAYLKKMEELRGMKFKVIFIDYVNIMKNWRNPNSENTYYKVKQIAEDLRAMGQRNGWAIVTATQTKSGDFDSSDLHMGSAAESSALAHTVDAMFGIIQDPLMHANREYFLKALALRDEEGKNTKKKFNVDYSYMRIAEDFNSDIILDSGLG